VKHITILSASVGAGHDGAAAELARRLREQGFTVGCHDFLDVVPAAMGKGLRKAYETQLKVAPDSWGWLLGALNSGPLAAGARGGCRLLAKRLARLVSGSSLVISTYPMASQALGSLRSRGLLDVPVATFLTDMSVHPLWVAAGVDLHLALHPVAAHQALALGAAGVHVGGPAVRPEFRPARHAERAAARLRFGLPGDLPRALVVAGSWGVGDVRQTARDIAATGLATPVVVCGSNQALYDSVDAGIALGWVDDMPALMRGCDLVVQNAGGLSSLEARASGLPVISYRCLPGHGSTNAEALHQAGWASWVHEPYELATALRTALESHVSLTPTADPAEILAAVAAPAAAVRLVA
jgi:UDP-N-acetylglucosamine:LPS N-acetylglucosamine transferase